MLPTRNPGGTMPVNRISLLLGFLVAGCANEAERPVVPITPELTSQVYDLTLRELKRLLRPKARSSETIDWSNRMYLNPMVLLPPADSANSMMHDAQWLAGVSSANLVNGICGRPPAAACPADTPVAFTSLGIPWTRGGDTTYLQAGYVGESPGHTRYDGVFWLFTITRDLDTDTLKVSGKGPPNYVTYESNGR